MNEESKPVVTDGAGGFGGFVRTLRLVWRLLQDGRVPTWCKLIIPAALIYVISPIDLLPDFILGLGQLDDIAIVLLSVSFFVEICPREIVEEHRHALQGRGAASGEPPENIIEGAYRVLDGDEPSPRP